MVLGWQVGVMDIRLVDEDCIWKNDDKTERMAWVKLQFRAAEVVLG